MTGPEHYRAQVHATLALAAATAMADTDAMREADYKAWKAAAGCPASDGDVR